MPERQLRLIVMRHAKSDWDSNAPTDHARPLNRRGRRDAPRVAQCLKDRNWIPDLVLSSDAQRTSETWERMGEVLGDHLPVEFLPSLYHAGHEEISEALCTVDTDRVGCVLVLGHNPGWQSAVSWLSGASVHMTTANAALLQCTRADWPSVAYQQSAWQFVDIIRPKEIA